MIHAPAPGSHTGVADYAEALGDLGNPAIDLYHLGNNPLHEAIYARALAHPGVVVLHDAVLHHFLLGTLSRAGYLDEFVYNYGEWHRHLAEQLWEERAVAAVDPRYFRYPMLRRAVERTRAVIVHNPGAAAMARAHGAQNVFVVPHFHAESPSPHACDTASFRNRLGIPQSAVLFGIFGYLRESKRVLPSLHAFGKLHAMRPDTALLLAGEAVSADLDRALALEAAQPGIHRMGRLSERELQIAMATVDCCVNLRYPAAGETSGIAIRAMGAGRPVMFTGGPEIDDLPRAACLRVQPGIAEAAELLEYMMLVAACPRVAKQIGGEARRHIRQHHSLEAVTSRYREILCIASSSPSPS